MRSYRAYLALIGIDAHTPVSYRDFASRPSRLSDAVSSMSAPDPSGWVATPEEDRRDEDWTDEVQGVAVHRDAWIFTTDANPAKTNTMHKAIFAFPKGPYGSGLRDGDWSIMTKFSSIPHPVASHESDDHWGAVTCHGDRFYVGHFWMGDRADIPQGSVVVLTRTDVAFEYAAWIDLEMPLRDGVPTRVEFQGINPWDGLFYSCFGDGDITEFFTHHPEGHPRAGRLTGRSLRLGVPISAVQGACFTETGHLYVSTNEYGHVGGVGWQLVHYFSALNGHYYGAITVPADQPMGQELEGLFVTPTETEHPSLHVVLNDNVALANDNLILKHYTATTWLEPLAGISTG